MSRTILDKTSQHIANYQPLNSLQTACLPCTIPDECNPYSLGILAFLNSARIMGNPMDVWLHAGNLLITQLIVNIPLSFVSIGSPQELTRMESINSKSSVAWKITDFELDNI